MKAPDIEVHKQKPEGFNPQIQVAACYVEIDHKLLLLQQAGKLETGKWGVPAGKMERNETPEQAAKRELFEETGISAAVQYLSSLYIRKPEIEYIYHLFKVHLDEAPDIHLSPEHSNYKWASLQDLETMPLMLGAREALEHYRAALIKKKRSGATINAYLLLRQGNTVLLSLRKNTGYYDGMWGLVAGHVEDGEPATAAMIREAQEEIGIEISPSDIKVIHVMHRQSNRLNIDIFFDCTVWKGTIQNCETEKCEKLTFFPLDALPPNLIDYQEAVLRAAADKKFYSELGWKE